MMKEHNERHFQQNSKHLEQKRFNAIKILNKQEFCLNEDKEFLENIDQKNYMAQDERKEFNQKNSQLYGKLQAQYLKCLKNQKIALNKKRAIEKVQKLADTQKEKQQQK